MENLVGKKVRISCPVFKNGRTFYGVVKSIKKETERYITYNVIIDGNTKTSSLANCWLTEMKPISNDIILKITKKAPLDISIVNSDIIGFRVLGSAATAIKKLCEYGFDAVNIRNGFIKIKNISYTMNGDPQ